MFKRIILEEWHHLVPYLCFALIAGAFVLIVVRALRMKQSEADRLAGLPLKKDHSDQIEPPEPDDDE